MEPKPEQINKLVEIGKDCTGFSVFSKEDLRVGYEFIESEAGDIEHRLNTAFDVLFAEVLKTAIEKPY